MLWLTAAVVTASPVFDYMGPLRTFFEQFKAVCGSELVPVDNSGVLVRFESLMDTYSASEADLKRVGLAPLAAMHSCASVPGSIHLSEYAIAFYAVFMRQEFLKFPVNGKLKDIQKSTVCGNEQQFKSLIRVAAMAKSLDFHKLHQVYAIGFIYRAHIQDCPAAKPLLLS